MLWIQSLLKTLFLLFVLGLIFQIEPVILLTPLLLVVGVAFSFRLFNQIKSLFQEFFLKQKPQVGALWPTVENWKQGFTSLIVAGIATIISMGWVSLFLLMSGAITVKAGMHMGLTPNEMNSLGKSLGRAIAQNSESLANQVTSIWIVTGTCLYQYDSWIKQRRQRRKQKNPKHQAKTTSENAKSVAVKSFDPIDVELDQMRGELGMTKMKRSPSKFTQKTKKGKRDRL